MQGTTLICAKGRSRPSSKSPKRFAPWSYATNGTWRPPLQRQLHQQQRPLQRRRSPKALGETIGLGFYTPQSALVRSWSRPSVSLSVSPCYVRFGLLDLVVVVFHESHTCCNRNGYLSWAKYRDMIQLLLYHSGCLLSIPPMFCRPVHRLQSLV